MKAFQLAIGTILALLPSLAFAHPLRGTGLTKELNHPLLGIDHLLDEPFLYVTALIVLALSLGVREFLKKGCNGTKRQKPLSNDKKT